MLAFAGLYVGEGATMASEAAVLGTPAVYVNTLTMGYVQDEERYGLLHHFTNGRAALGTIRDLLATPALKPRYASAGRGCWRTRSTRPRGSWPWAIAC